MNSYYEALGLKEGATTKEIKKAYREKALECHPDTNPGDVEAEEKFKKISEAYAILTGKEKPKPQHKQGFSRRNHNQRPAQFVNKGRTIHIEVSIPMEKAYSGGRQTVTFQAYNKCVPCDGVGGTGISVCNQCNGNGMTQEGPFVFMCNNCRGSGKLFANTCTTCHGNGKVVGNKTIDVQITKGTTDKSVAMGHGVGNYVQGGVEGDVLFIIRIESHPIFTLEGMDLKRDVDIPYLDVMLGRELEFNTLNGKVKITIPKLCEPNKVFRLKGKGFIDGDLGVAGDLYVKLNPILPKEISKEEESLIKQLRETPNFEKIN